MNRILSGQILYLLKLSVGHKVVCKAQQPCPMPRHALLNHKLAPNTLSEKAGSYFSVPKRIQMDLAVDTQQWIPKRCLLEIETQSIQVQLWPIKLDAFLPSQFQLSSLLPSKDSRCQKVPTQPWMFSLKIQGLYDQDKLASDNGYQFKNVIKLRTHGQTQYVHWYVNGQYRGQFQQFNFSPQRLGQHQITAVNDAGQIDSISVNLY